MGLAGTFASAKTGPMVAMFTLRSRLGSPEATAAFAASLAPRLRAGDVLLLTGDLGAGKSHFARSLIRASLGDPTAEVPSPSFTLVQTYETAETEIWHTDLYRLTGSDEVLELGLDTAFDTAICLVEWPDRLGADRPPGAFDLGFEITGDTTRMLQITGPEDRRALFEDLPEMQDA